MLRVVRSRTSVGKFAAASATVSFALTAWVLGATAARSCTLIAPPFEITPEAIADMQQRREQNYVRGAPVRAARLLRRSRTVFIGRIEQVRATGREARALTVRPLRSLRGAAPDRLLLRQASFSAGCEFEMQPEYDYTRRQWPTEGDQVLVLVSNASFEVFGRRFWLNAPEVLEVTSARGPLGTALLRQVRR